MKDPATKPRPPSPSPDILDGYIKLADMLEKDGGADSIDVERLLELSALAAAGLRRLVDAHRALGQWVDGGGAAG